MYNLEPENGRSYLYKLEGETIVVNQLDVGDMIFLQIMKEDVSQEELEKFKIEISQASGNRKIVILPPWVTKLKVSPLVNETSQGSVMQCTTPGCQGKLRQIPQSGEFMCFSCGRVKAPDPSRGQPIEMGGF